MSWVPFISHHLFVSAAMRVGDLIQSGAGEEVLPAGLEANSEDKSTKELEPFELSPSTPVPSQVSFLGGDPA